MVGFSTILAPICRGGENDGVGGMQKPVGRENGANSGATVQAGASAPETNGTAIAQVDGARLAR